VIQLGKLFITLCVGAILLPLAAHGGVFGISPIRVDLDRENKTASVTVSNDDPDKKLEMRATLFEWSQDAAGKDVYTESSDLVYFPRIFTIEKQDQRVVRVGLKVPARATEKAYRLFIEELPPPRDPQQKGAAVVFVLRFGIPIFLRPDKEQSAAAIERIEVTPGKAAVIVKNGGNQNFQIQSLVIKAGSLLEKEIVGGYVLAGASKQVISDVPPDVCRKLDKVQILMKTDRIGSLEKAFDWDASRCGAQ
jgi:fimbrial chaperone protein